MSHFWMQLPRNRWEALWWRVKMVLTWSYWRQTRLIEPLWQRWKEHESNLEDVFERGVEIGEVGADQNYHRGFNVGYAKCEADADEEITRLQALLDEHETTESLTAARLEAEDEVTRLRKQNERLREGIRNIRDFEQSFVNKDGAHTATVRLLDGLLVDEESEAEA
jgi:hypothetical protein